MNIILIGYRGAGKSVVGVLLAQRLLMKYVSMDEEIIRGAGMTIPEIVEKFGWPKFRDMETEVALALSGKDHQVIDTGGGVIERPDNMDYLRRNSLVFWLKAAVETIISRIHTDTQRPALVEGKTFTEEVADVLKLRAPKYRLAAHHDIDTDMRTPEEIAERIIEIWEKH